MGAWLISFKIFVVKLKNHTCSQFCSISVADDASIVAQHKNHLLSLLSFSQSRVLRILN